MTQKLCLHPTTDLIRSIIKKEMDIADDHIWIYGEGWKIPQYKDLSVVIEYKYGRAYSNRRPTTSVSTDQANTLTSNQRLNKQEFLTVQLFSRTREAEFRKEEVSFALNSVYAQQVQEQFGFHLARILPDQNLTYWEGSSMLKRFDVPIIVLTHYRKDRAIDFFDSFDGELNINEGSNDVVIDFTQPLINPVQ